MRAIKCKKSPVQSGSFDKLYISFIDRHRYPSILTRSTDDSYFWSCLDDTHNLYKDVSFESIDDALVWAYETMNVNGADELYEFNSYAEMVRFLADRLGE